MSLKTRRQSSHFIANTSLRNRVRRWWLAKSDSEQRSAVSRAALVTACAMGLTFALPAISSANTQKEEEADFREQTLRFAEAQDGGEAVRRDPSAPAVMQHEWLRNVEYSLERDPKELRVGSVSSIGFDTAEIESLSMLLDQAHPVGVEIDSQDLTLAAHQLGEVGGFSARCGAEI